MGIILKLRKFWGDEDGDPGWKLHFNLIRRTLKKLFPFKLTQIAVKIFYLQKQLGSLLEGKDKKIVKENSILKQIQVKASEISKKIVFSLPHSSKFPPKTTAIQKQVRLFPFSSSLLCFTEIAIFNFKQKETQIGLLKIEINLLFRI